MPICLPDFPATRPITFDTSCDVDSLLDATGQLLDAAKRRFDTDGLPPQPVHAYLLERKPGVPRIDALALWDDLTLADVLQIAAVSQQWKPEPADVPKMCVGCFGPPELAGFPSGRGWWEQAHVFMSSPLLFAGPVDTRGIDVLLTRLAAFDVLDRSTLREWEESRKEQWKCWEEWMNSREEGGKSWEEWVRSWPARR